MAHSLPGLSNNLLSIREVFFNATGCEVTLNGEIILRGWRHRLWLVRIVDDGWTTNLKVSDVASPPPTEVAHSLYDCDNTQS
jgi:hypothetical protein